MINLDEIIRQLVANAAAIQALAGSVSDEQARWQPEPNTWPMWRVMEHVYNEERIDFRLHLKEMFSHPPQPWSEWRHENYLPVPNCQQALKLFLEERKASIQWLQALVAPDWEASSMAQFGPSETVTLRAGDVLVSWVDHDYLHIRQFNELLHAWNEQQGAPYSVRYAGGW